MSARRADTHRHENVTDWLDQMDVPYWHPSEIKTGSSSLGDQLRTAVQKCSVCVFVATHASVRSSWCGAELGAFWGASVPIIVYLADSSLPEKDLPPILQGAAWERKLSVVATRAAELDGQDRAVPEASTLVSNMNVSQLEKVLVGALSLVLAQDKEPSGLDISQAAGRVLRAGVAVGLLEGDDWKRHILWVDDHPDNNRHERTAFESFDIEFTLATSTSQAMALLSHRRYGAIISDMGRAEGPEEGFALLNQLRANDQATPFFLYTGPAAREYQLEAAARGAQGVTADPSELVDMVTKALR